MRVIKVGGAVCLRSGTLDGLAKAWRRDGGLTVVHGGGPQLDEALAARGGPVRRVDGLRVTDERDARVVRATLDRIGAQMARGLRCRGVPARHVASDADWFDAVPKRTRDGRSLGRVGTVRGCMAKTDARKVLVVTPVGHDARGPLNINADEGALAVAMALRAGELLLATDVPHVRGLDGSAVARLDPQGARDLIAAGIARAGMVPKLRAASEAVEAGVGCVRIGSVSCAWAPGGTIVVPRRTVASRAAGSPHAP